MSVELPRCPWPTDALYLAYHDQEWGVPRHEDQYLFEMLILEGAQAVGMVNDHLVHCFRHREISRQALAL